MGPKICTGLVLILRLQMIENLEKNQVSLRIKFPYDYLFV